MILFFSGVGNSRYVAYEVAKKTHDKVYSMNELIDQNKFNFKLSNGENLGIVVPVYFLGLPSIAKDYLNKLSLEYTGKQYVYLIATYYDSLGSIEYMVNDILKKKGLRLNARFSLKMPTTYTPYFDAKNKHKNQKLLDKADIKLNNIIDFIQKKKNGDYLYSNVRRLSGIRYYKKNYEEIRKTKHLKVDISRCMGCGMCEINCPAHAIEMRDGHPVWIKEKCTMCLGCLHRCPKFAISYDDKTQKHGQYANPKMLYNSVSISRNNPGITKLLNCNNCGICKKTCIERENMPVTPDKYGCVNCGQCIMACPRNNIIPKSDIEKFLKAKKEGKILVAYTAPGVRVSIGDGFGFDKGEFLEEKLVGALRELGFKYVFDVTLGADMTIMEEASELIDRIKNKKKLPMITSCCPSWVKYAETFYPELLPNLSTTKSPISIEGALVKEYFAKVNNINKDDIYTVAITPCTAKKYEVKRDEIDGTDLVLTIREIINYMKKINVDLRKIKDSNFDSLLSDGSGAGLIFGNTGGVMEAALRTANYLITKKDLETISFSKIHGYNSAREGHFKFGDTSINVLVVDEMASARPFLDEIKEGKSKYDFIEIMNCRGGCIGGGGQPIYRDVEEDSIKDARMKSLYNKDKKMDIRYSYKSKDVKKIYKDFLEKPLSEKSEELLHTNYSKKHIEN